MPQRTKTVNNSQIQQYLFLTLLILLAIGLVIIYIHQVHGRVHGGGQLAG
jgi:hypothetical protein